MLYGHYDVQPANKADGWNTDPFKLAITKSRLFGRGVVDNKGQFLIHVATILDLIKHNKLKFNIKFLLEGNEETANPEIAGIIKENKDMLAADIVVVSDGEIVGNNPVIDSSFRGGFNIKFIFKTANTPLHSGIYGGAVPNAAYELSKTLAKLYDNQNKVSFADFYTGAPKPTTLQIKNNKSFPFALKDILKGVGVKQALTEIETDFLTQTGLRPTAQISGIASGYIGEGFANIVPNTAEVKINVRTAPGQKPKPVLEALLKFFKTNTPKYVKLTSEIEGIHDGAMFDMTTQKVKHAVALLEKAHKTKVFFKNVGGALPVIVHLNKILKTDTLSISLCNEDCNMHGVNENFKIDLVKKALEFSKLFFGS